MTTKQKRFLVVIAAILALASFSLASDDKKKEEKNAPRKIEITGDATKVRAALIKLELDSGYILGDEQTSRVIFTEKKAGVMRSALTGGAHFRDLFVFASGSDVNSLTVYATTEFCARTFRDERMDCKVQNHKHWIERLDKLLAALKIQAEGK